MESLQSFLTQLFTELNNEDSFAILFFLFIAFLIGLIFGRFSIGGKYRKLKKQLPKKESELIALQAEHHVLQEQFEENETKLKKTEAQNVDLKKQNAALEKEKMESQGNLYAAADQIEKLKKSNLANLSKIEALNHKITNLQSSNSSLSSEVERDVEVINDLSQIQSSYAETINRLGALENKLNKLEQENSGLQAEINTLKDTSAVAFVDVDLDESELEESKDESALKAKNAIKATLGKNIPLAEAKNKNELTEIKGIGPFIENKLNEIGIYTFKQISQFDDEFIQLVTEAIQFFPGRIKRDDWVGQAKKLDSKK